MSARQLHNAHNQLRETIIRYRFHPRYGQTVTVTSRIRRGNDVAVTIRQPDGTLAQLPIWMTEDSAEAMAVTEIPRLPQAHLRELRLELDTCLSLLQDDSRREASMTRRQRNQRQSDLFVPKKLPIPMTASERTKLLPLVSALLSEILSVVAVTEAGDEDHA